MKYRRLGNSGLKVSALGLGTNAFGKRADEASSRQILDYALDHGINFIDTANIYTGSESERIIGAALESKRDRIVLATKAGLTKGAGPNERGSSRFHIMKELESSLKRLRTDYVDLYQIHTFDPDTPLEETLRALEDMIRSGKVRYIGASNYKAWELMKALGISDRFGLNRYISTQCSYSLADRTPENELVPLCLDQGVGIIPYFPLAGGILTGKYSTAAAGQAAAERSGLSVSGEKAGEQAAAEQAVVPAGSRADKDPSFQRFLIPERIQLGDEVVRLAAETGTSSAALSLAWLMERPAVPTVIVGATSASQLQESLRSAELQLDESIQAKLEQISLRFRYEKPMAIYRLPKE